MAWRCWGKLAIMVTTHPTFSVLSDTHSGFPGAHQRTSAGLNYPPSRGAKHRMLSSSHICSSNHILRRDAPASICTCMALLVRWKTFGHLSNIQSLCVAIPWFQILRNGAIPFHWGCTPMVVHIQSMIAYTPSVGYASY